MDRRRFVKRISAGTLGATISIPGMNSARAGRVPSVAPSDQINLGVIGTGSRGQWMMRNMLRVPGVNVTAICDVYDRRFREGREITGEETPVYTDYQQMLDEAEVDVVLVASPLRHHGEQMVAALDSGRHVFGEKAMAFTADECDQIVDAVQRNNKLFQVGHQLRYASWYQEALQRIQEGEIGDVTHVFGYWHRNNNWRRPVPDDATDELINWRMYLRYSRGLLAELGSHHIDITNWLFNDVPVSVTGSGSILFYDDGRETYDNVQTIFNYPDGRSLVFSSLLGNHKLGCQIIAYGTGGTAELTLGDAYFYYEPRRPDSAVPGETADEYGVETSPTLEVEGDMPYRGRGERIEVSEGDPGADLAICQSFIDDIRSGRTPFANEKVGWASSVPVAYGHQAIRDASRIDFSERVKLSAIAE